MNLADILYSDPTLIAADAAYVERGNSEQRREYLGMSQIGDSCARRLWYSFRWAGREQFDSATLKRFEDGHRTEDLIVNRLKLVEGLDVVATGHNGQQIRVVDHGGHFSGHLDGTVIGLHQAPKTKHVLEIKCVSDKKFAEFKKAVRDHGEKSALKVWNPVYYAQAQSYMHYMDLTRHYIVVATAGGRDWYSARTEYDKKYALQIVAKAKRIIDSNEPLEKLSDTPTWYECKWCAYKDICHGDTMPDRTCRTCLHSTATPDGRWHCARWGKHLTGQEQEQGCPSHAYLPALVPGKVVSAKDNRVTYKLNNGEMWQDGE